MRKLVRSVRRSIRARLALAWRPFVDGVTFIAVTGSCGKTTTTVLLDRLLRSKGPTNTRYHHNSYGAADAAVLKTRRWHRWCVQEVSGHAPGQISRQTQALRPQVGIVTLIGTDHIKQFRSPDAIAQEKGGLIEVLPENGLAVLNADDARVLAMKGRTRARVVTFGRSPEADLRATDVTSALPDRLSLTVSWRGQSVRLQCQIVGEFWVTSILAAMACSLEQGMTLEEVVPIVEGFKPMFMRNSVHMIVDGPTFLLDTIKAPYGTIGAALDTLASAQAPRKTLVLGNISDFSGAGSRKYRAVARSALDTGARVIGVGPNAAVIQKLASERQPGEVMAFRGIREARDYLRAHTAPGELVVLKSAESLHIERIFLNWAEEGDRCWIEGCGLKDCHRCRHLTDPRRRPKHRVPTQQTGE